uniref:Dolichyl-phosphate N-acetylglucosaminephosphotransferase 1 n=1 Tax=Mus musculus TaxID=10090 RepID=A0A1L1STS5_MOUSE
MDKLSCLVSYLQCVGFCLFGKRWHSAVIQHQVLIPALIEDLKAQTVSSWRNAAPLYRRAPLWPGPQQAQPAADPRVPGSDQRCCFPYHPLLLHPFPLPELLRGGAV